MALESALRWQYDPTTLDHINNNGFTINLDPRYQDDVLSMKAGVEVVEKYLGIDLIAVIKSGRTDVTTE